MNATALLLIMALILVITAIYSITNRETYTREFNKEIRNLMDEAVLIRKDLEAVIENAALISDSMIQNLDERLERIESLSQRATPAKAPLASISPKKKGSKGRPLPFKIEELRKAHPYLIVPRLYEEGLSVAEIAEILDKGQGEIRLILEIQKRKEVGS